jgi:hypothetical protein
MHEILLGKKFVFGFTVVWVIHATVNWTNGSTLWFIVKTYAFSAFFVSNEVNVHVNGIL